MVHIEDSRRVIKGNTRRLEYGGLQEIVQFGVNL